MAPRPLLPHEIDLWIVDPDRLVAEAPLLRAYEKLLDGAERERFARFTWMPARHQFLVARALVRTSLSRYVDGVPPEAWTFEAMEHGRPRIVGPPAALAPERPLDFNLSHTNGLVVVAVARRREVGVDVEDTTRSTDCARLAPRFFSPAEAAEILGREPERRVRRFFDYWTLKEAYIKARGLGLQIPLSKFSFHLDGEAEISISTHPELADRPATWQFFQLEPTTRHLVGLAARRIEGAPEASLRVRFAVPLVDPPLSPRPLTLATDVGVLERLFADPDLFIAALAERGAGRIVLRHIHEHRPIPGSSFVPDEKYRRIELLSYVEGTLYKCVLEGRSPADLAGRIAAAGLSVKIVSGNFT